MDTVKIDARDVNFWYGDFHALKGISMQIEEKSVVAFIGPSGCGKSTFLRLFNRMNDLIPATRLEGEIRIDGHNIYAKGVEVDELRKNVGMVFQRPNPFPTMNIYDNVLAGYILNGIHLSKSQKDEIVERNLRNVCLWDEVKDSLTKRGTFLSGGQQQRLCIARSLALQPDVLLMDEPTSALDPIATKHIEGLMDQLKKEVTILIVTHNMSQAMRISDRSMFMYMGELIEYDNTEKMFKDPVDERTRAYLTGKMG